MNKEKNTKWYIISKVHIAYEDYQVWLQSSAVFLSNINIYNCDTNDPFVSNLVGGSIKSPFSSMTKFYANELADMTLSTFEEIVIIHYNKKDSTLDLIIEINREKSFNMVVFNVAMLLSIVKYKNNNIKDICLISQENIDNVLYVIEFSNEGVNLHKNTIGNFVVPKTYYKIFNMLKSIDPISEYLEKDIYDIFTDFILKRLEKDKKNIIRFSSPERISIISHDAVYRTDGKNVLLRDGRIVKGADPISLFSLGHGYAIDKNNVYYEDSIIENADNKTFLILNYGYAKDKDFAYYEGKVICENTCNFRTLKNAKGYATNNIVVFYKDKTLQGSEPLAFQPIGDVTYSEAEYVILDDFFVYQNGKVVTGFDRDTFKSIGKNFYADINNVYFIVTKIGELKPETTQIINEYFIMDENAAFYCDKENIIQLEDFDTVNPNIRVQKQLIINNNNVYYKGTKIDGLNGNEVEIDENFSGYIKDSKSVYYYLNRIDTDVNKFVILGYGYATDNDKLFFKDKIIKEGVSIGGKQFVESSYNSLTTISGEDNIQLGGNFRKLKNSIYYKSKPLNNVDSNSFKTFMFKHGENIIPTKYGKDNNHVYYKFNIIEEADVETFQALIHPNYTYSDLILPSVAVDKSHVYFKGKIVQNLDPSDVNPFAVPRSWISKGVVMCNGKVVDGIDTENFHQIEDNIFTDNKLVYYKIIPINNINPEKLLIISQNYIKDENNFCYIEEDKYGNLLANSFSPHTNSFDILGENEHFSYDRFAIYFKGLKIEGINMEKINFIGDDYLHDDTAVYYGNVKLENVDLGFFMLLGDGYASDGIHTFYQDKNLQVENMLHVLGNGYASDGISFWYYGEELDNPYEHQYITDVLGQGF